jgi:hypothetical protein
MKTACIRHTVHHQLITVFFSYAAFVPAICPETNVQDCAEIYGFLKQAAQYRIVFQSSVP